MLWPFSLLSSFSSSSWSLGATARRPQCDGKRHTSGLGKNGSGKCQDPWQGPRGRLHMVRSVSRVLVRGG